MSATLLDISHDVQKQSSILSKILTPASALDLIEKMIINKINYKELPTEVKHELEKNFRESKEFFNGLRKEFEKLKNAKLPDDYDTLILICHAYSRQNRIWPEQILSLLNEIQKSEVDKLTERKKEIVERALKDFKKSVDVLRDLEEGVINPKDVIPLTKLFRSVREDITSKWTIGIQRLRQMRAERGFHVYRTS